jgi:hypothetical protein
MYKNAEKIFEKQNIQELTKEAPFKYDNLKQMAGFEVYL